MKTYLKRIAGIFGILGMVLCFANTAFAKDWFGDITQKYGENVGNPVNEVGVIGTTSTTEDNGYAILDTIQTAINWVLGMLSLVALVLCLWGGFQMLTAGGDDGKVKTGTKILKNAGIGLAVIGLAWLIVSFVFRIVNKTSGG